MKPLKKWFVIIMTAVTMLAVFAIADIILAGVIMFAVSAFTTFWQFDVFKWVFLITFAIEFVITSPAAYKSYKEGDKE